MPHQSIVGFTHLICIMCVCVCFIENHRQTSSMMKSYNNNNYWKKGKSHDRCAASKCSLVWDGLIVRSSHAQFLFMGLDVFLFVLLSLAIYPLVWLRSFAHSPTSFHLILIVIVVMVFSSVCVCVYGAKIAAKTHMARLLLHQFAVYMRFASNKRSNFLFQCVSSDCYHIHHFFVLRGYQTHTLFASYNFFTNNFISEVVFQILLYSDWALRWFALSLADADCVAFACVIHHSK